MTIATDLLVEVQEIFAENGTEITLSRPSAAMYDETTRTTATPAPAKWTLLAVQDQDLVSDTLASAAESLVPRFPATFYALPDLTGGRQRPIAGDLVVDDAGATWRVSQNARVRLLGVDLLWQLGCDQG